MATSFPALNRIRKPGCVTIGVELPLDNDWSADGETRRLRDGRPHGVPELTRHADLVRQVDRSGFAAIWMRDVPVFDTVNMGDAGSVYDVFAHLGFLAGITHRVALGTAAVVLPIRHPMMVAKAAASVDALSGGRLVLGVASGDRPIEYPLLGCDFEKRGEAFRSAVDYLRTAWQPGGLPVADGMREPALDLLPRPVQSAIPLVIAGRGQQSPEWIAGHMDGRFVYPGPVERLAREAAEWRTANGGVFITAFHLDLADDPREGPKPIRFGARMGRHVFLDHLGRLAEAGIHHLAVNLRRSSRPVPDALDELAREILPHFGGPIGLAA